MITKREKVKVPIARGAAGEGARVRRPKGEVEALLRAAGPRRDLGAAVALLLDGYSARYEKLS